MSKRIIACDNYYWGSAFLSCAAQKLLNYSPTLFRQLLATNTASYQKTIRLLCCLVALLFVKATLANTLPTNTNLKNISISFSGNFSTQEKLKLNLWLNHVADAMTSVYGELPRDNIPITLIPLRQANQAVPYARVIRDETDSLSFYVNPQFPLKAFIDDWTAYHEFSHLMIPYPGDSGIWFSEGLASYYQNIVMARAKIITSQRAWEKLYAGFERGRHDTKMHHLNLAELSPNMWNSRSFMRVYWSGAYYFFAVDVALRQRHQSLDTVLKSFRDCCLQLKRSWTAKQLATQMDILSQSDIFTRHYMELVNSFGVPDYSHIFNAIGLQFTNNDKIRKTHTSLLHTAIMSD